MKRTAKFSDCGLYRYSLGREWDTIKPKVCWVMLNPSIADADIDDPTIRRCIGYSRAWGYGGLWVVNIFAIKATNPAELYKVVDPVGPFNNATILEHVDKSTLVVCAWGNHGAYLERGTQVRAMFERAGLRAGLRVSCLTMTKAGQPGHPLYLSNHLEPMNRFS